MVTAAGQSCLLAFDRTNPEAIRWARQRAAFLVREVNAQTRAAIREIIAQAFADGIPARRAATMIRNIPVGLTQHQSKAVTNLAKSLQDAALRADALGRPVTVSYGDHQVRVPARRVVIDGERRVVNTITRRSRVRVPPGGLSADRMAQIQKRYAERLRRARALNIARTESINAVRAGQQQSWKQNVEAGLLRGTERQRWSSTNDERRCEICWQLEGQEVALGEVFESSFVGPLDGPTAHPQCRCVVTLVV